MNQIKYAMVKYYSFDENNLGFVNMFGMMKKMEHSGVAIKGAIFSLLKIQIAFDGTNDKSKFHHLYNFIQTKKATYKELEPYINKIKKTLRNNYLEIYGERA